MRARMPSGRSLKSKEIPNWGRAGFIYSLVKKHVFFTLQSFVQHQLRRQPCHQLTQLQRNCRILTHTTWFHAVVFNYNIAKHYFLFTIQCFRSGVPYLVLTCLCSLFCVHYVSVIFKMASISPAFEKLIESISSG